MKNLVSMCFLILLVSCSSKKSKLETSKLDSTSTSGVDTAKISQVIKTLERNGKSVPEMKDIINNLPKTEGYQIPLEPFNFQDTLQIATIDVDYSCDQAYKIITDSTSGIEETNLAMMKWAQCKTKDHNAKNPNNQYVTVVTEEVDQNGNSKILFNTIKLSAAEKIADASKALFGIAVYTKTKNPLTTLITSAAGNYTVDSYLQAAKENDPLIILFPTAIPGNKLTKDVYKSISQSKSGKKVEAVISKGIEHGKKHPEDIIAPTVTVPLKEGVKLFKKIFK